MLSKVDITVFGKYYLAHGDHNEKHFEGWKLEQLYEDFDDDRLGGMSLQCEACGPDLELYEMMRRRH